MLLHGPLMRLVSLNIKGMLCCKSSLASIQEILVNLNMLDYNQRKVGTKTSQWHGKVSNSM